MELNQSENINEICAALASVQSEISNPVKSVRNDFFKSTYADLPSVLEIARTVLPEHGLAFSQPITVIEGKPYLVTLLMHKSGQWLRSIVPIVVKDQVTKDRQGNQIFTPGLSDPQKVGSGITYMRRYALQAMIGIVGADDDDDATKNSPIDSKRVKELESLIAGDEHIRNRILKHYDVLTLHDITQGKFDQIKKGLIALQKQKQELEQQNGS